MFVMITWGLCAIIIFMLAGVMSKIDEIRRLLVKAAADGRRTAAPAEAKPAETTP